MDQVNYKGYARSVGFDPVKAPYAALQRMEERDSRILRGMEDNRRAAKQVRDEYGAGLERKFSLEDRNRDQNYNLLQKYRENRASAVESNAKTIIQNHLEQSKSIQNTMGSLAKFSDTISSALMDFQKGKNESDMKAGYMEAASGGFTLERQTAVAQGETVLQTAGEAQDRVAENFQAVGAPADVVMGLMTGNKWRDYGRLKAYWDMNVGEFSGYAQSKLTEMGAITAADRQAAMPDIFEGFIRDKGLFGLKADFLAEGLIKMRGQYNALVDDARKSDVVNQSLDMRDEAMENLFRSKSGDAFSEALRLTARTYAEDGKTPIGLGKARAMLYKELGDTTRYTEQDVERILSGAMTDNGQSMKDRFGRDYDDLITSRRKDAEAEFALNQAEERQQQKAAEKSLLKWVDENWDGSAKTLNDIIKEAETKGIPTDRLKAHLARSNEQKNADFWKEQFDTAYDQGTLTLEDVDQPGVPWEVRKEYRERAQEQERLRGESGIKQETVKGEFQDLIKSKLVGESTDRAAHFSAKSAADYALRVYNSKFKQYSMTMEPAKAAAQARNDVLTAIEKGTGAFKVIGSADAKGKQAYFGAFTPGKHAGAPAPVDIIDVSVVKARVTANPSIISKQVVVSPGLLRDIDNRINNGKPFSIPQALSDLGKSINMTPVEVLNAQLQAAGLSARVRPGFRETLNQIQDPRLRAILDQPLTQERLNSVIIGSGNAPATVRTGSQGYADVVALGTAAGFKFPQAMAAMWALESGYGKYHSNPNNVFNIKDRRTGQFKSYASPLESAKDFMYLMTDPKYAPALNAAKTPRQFIEGIAMTYSGQERDYASKILRVMRDNGVNPDQPFNNNPNPARNNGFMRPTLAYITGDIGPTSTGEHLDVKDVTGKRFAENALDNFVEIQDPEYGRITLGALKKKLPGRGDNFDEHVARGSHGIDYPTAKGTKLFIKNGARIISKARTAHGDKVVIQLPDGRRFSFLHGNAV